MPAPGEPPLRPYRLRIIVFIVLALALACGLGIGFQILDALRRLDVVEAERDRWQRPSAIIDSLGVGEGGAVVDLGSGVGYFAVKLSPRVGPTGRVLAVDLRRSALLFLRLRTLLAGIHNIATVEAREADPRIPADAADAVLVANTYHEITTPDVVLAHVRRALRPGGRLVVVDPAPGPDETSPAAGHRHVSADSAEREIRAAGFDIVSRQDRFAEPPGEPPWWLIVAHKP